MRKTIISLMTFAVFLGPAIFAEDPLTQTESTRIWLDNQPADPADNCRQQCAEDQEDPDDCQLICNAVG